MKLYKFVIKYKKYKKYIDDDNNKILPKICINCKKSYYPRKTSTHLYCSGECEYSNKNKKNK